MSKNMLIDAAHAEETRVVVVDGNRVEEFDFESQNRKQLRGNIYLAKVTRVEPSLQAAFVEYGGNRHGFLAFNEIHPDYYQIPVADREALIAEQERRARQSEESESSGGGRRWRRRPQDRDRRPAETTEETHDVIPGEGGTALAPSEAHDLLTSDGNADAMPATPPTENSGDDTRSAPHADTAHEGDIEDRQDERRSQARADWPVIRDDGPHVESDAHHAPSDAQPAAPIESPESQSSGYATRADTHHADRSLDAGQSDEGHPDGERADSGHTENDQAESGYTARGYGEDSSDQGAAGEDTSPRETNNGFDANGDQSTGEDRQIGEQGDTEATNVETLGGEDLGEEERPRRSASLRNYKIQEVIKRRQILLVQVVKEERGNKGAALTTYLSLAGRYCVLMPNAGRGGGISRKISNPADRKRMKEMLSELEVPSGMGVILRTAGLERSKAEIKRDYDYLVRLWDTIREVTLKSTAPALIYEEGNLIKRSIRDLYNKDIEDIAIEGEEGYRAAKDFMRQLMPSHAKKVQLYNDQTPLFHRYQVETQLDAMHSPVVQLRSGGYIVINPTEALVAIDVNSGRATKERNIEETALRTNAEAAEEIARQLRLRDLAGLIVIDFIDMEDSRHQQQVERRLKEAMRSDRARIQIGRISAFGLLELSRQRLRPSLLEISTEICPHCEGTGRVRSTESTVLHVLRGIEEEGIRRRAAEIRVAVPTAVALYLLNQKRGALAEIEMRYGLRVFVDGDESLIPPHYKLERIRTRPVDQQAPVPLSMTSATYDLDEEAVDEVEESDEETSAEGETAERVEETSDDASPDGRGRRRRRRRRGGRRDDAVPASDEQSGMGGPSAPGMGDQPPVYGHDMVPEQLAVAESEIDDTEEGVSEGEALATGEQGGSAESEANRRRRRRGRRGGRRRRHGERDGQPGNGAEHGHDAPGAESRRPDADYERADHAPSHQPDNRPHEYAVNEPVRPLADRSPVQASERHQPDVATPDSIPAAPSPTPAVTSAPVEDRDAVEEEATPSGPPRRGWWQRLTTR